MSNTTVPVDTSDTTSQSNHPATSNTPVQITTPSSQAPSSSPSPSPSPTPTSNTPATSDDTTAALVTSIITVSPSTSDGTTIPASTSTYVVTETQSDSNTSSRTSATSTRTSTGTLASNTSSGSKSSGLSSGGTIAIAVVVPIVAISLLVAAGLFLWRRRKQKQEAAEERRREAEEYSYNPNNDPTLPTIAAAGGSDGQYEMREDGSSGYRGWGTTAMGTAGRKTSTHVSGGQSIGTENGVGMAYSGETSPAHGPVSDRSNEPLVDGNRPISGEQEALGAMGPSTSNNNSAGVIRGASNASSHYSTANRSEGSGNDGPPYSGNYYSSELPGETPYGSLPGRAEMGGQPVIRDVQARRNTRIENPSHFPQQSAGISQNF